MTTSPPSRAKRPSLKSQRLMARVFPIKVHQIDGVKDGDKTQHTAFVPSLLRIMRTLWEAVTEGA